MLSKTNAQLREDYQVHQHLLAAVDARTKLIADIAEARLAADAMLQDTRARAYETGHFRPQALWDSVAPQRAQVFALRERVFGTGRRVVTRAGSGADTAGGAGSGVRSGAGGRFDRLQWTLDGRARMVDALGRTEEEAEEERGLEEEDVLEEEGEGVLESQPMGPAWLLKFFESWGLRWGGKAKKAKEMQGPQAAGVGAAEWSDTPVPGSSGSGNASEIGPASPQEMDIDADAKKETRARDNIDAAASAGPPPAASPTPLVEAAGANESDEND